MVARGDYTDLGTHAVDSVLLEIHQVLAQYAQNIVVVGGSVPSLLIKAEEQHVGTLDIDLALDHRSIAGGGYNTIRELLLEAGYEETSSEFRFERKVEMGGQTVAVVVDLLSQQYGGSEELDPVQHIQDASAVKVRGCDLAFELNVEVNVSGHLPSGAEVTRTVKVADMVAFLTMKGCALVGRNKQKDAYDIVYCLKHYQESGRDIKEDFKNWVDNKLVREGLGYIAKEFSSENGRGPTMVADFEDTDDPEERELIKRDAFERVRAFLMDVGFSEVGAQPESTRA